MKIQKYQRGGGLLRLGSGLLDAAEFIPVVGDVLGMGRSALKRDWAGIGLSAAGLIPGIGNGATAAKAARKGVKAIAHGADAARTANKAADTVRTVKPDSIGWFKKPEPRTGTIVDELGDVKDAVLARRTTTVKDPIGAHNPGTGQVIVHNPSPNLPARVEDVVVRNPNLPVPSRAGGLATVTRNPNLPARTGDLIPVGPSTDIGGWRKHLGQHGWKYGAGAAALLGLGLLTRDDDESAASPEAAPVVEGGEVASPVATPVQPATPVYVPIESNQPQKENAPVETTVEQPENKIERPLDKLPSQFYNEPKPSIVPVTMQSDLTGVSGRLAKRLDKYNRVNRYGNFIKDLQEEHPESRYLNRVERRADRKEERAYNRLSKTAAKQGVNFGINQDESAYIIPLKGNAK